MSSKNPFEIRTDVLAMAKDYMDKQYQLNLEVTQKMIEAGKATIADLPAFYTLEELEKMAKQMYKFVETK
jgi:hypothetical protein